MVMFDTLNRRTLPSYGCEWVRAPNFERLTRRTVVFDNCYAGSMPCIPARRELHTGRYNFLHRGWGPLEPFDDSVPEMLKRHGVHTHLVTDHPQYWMDGGVAYHTRFSTFEFARGQAGDPWKGQVADPEPPEDGKGLRAEFWRQDWINRQHLADEADHPQTRAFDAAIEFVRTNCDQDCWLVYIDAFDPHEPFFSHEQYKRLYPHDYSGPHFDWPDYMRVTEEPAAVEHARLEYTALLSMCDGSLGRVLDLMDEYSLWEDTLLIVCTDHGWLLGEHDWWGKCVQPFYDEVIHTPLFVWDPRIGAQAERRQSLVQTIDLGPTLLEFFGVERTPDMQGVPLRGILAADLPVREAGLFGMFGGHVCVTDGRYVYMRAGEDASNQPLFEYTLMPTQMQRHFPVAALREAELAEPFAFTKGLRTLQVRGEDYGISAWSFGSLLYDLATDPDQQSPLIDDELELHMAGLLVELLRATDAPADQFARLGLPAKGKLRREHLLVRRQWPQVESSMQPAPTVSEFPRAEFDVSTPLARLLADPDAAQILCRHAPTLMDSPIASMGGSGLAAIGGSLSLIRIASMQLLQRAELEQIATELAELSLARTP